MKKDFEQQIIFKALLLHDKSTGQAGSVNNMAEKQGFYDKN